MTRIGNDGGGNRPERRRMAGIEKTLIRQMNDLADASCINLGLGELRFPTPRAILDHVRDNIGSWRLGYTPNEGIPELRDIIAARCGFAGRGERVCVTVGAQEALFAALMVLVDAGDEVLVPDPGYPAYASIVRIAGGVPRFYKLTADAGFALDIAAIERALSPSTTAVIVNSPHNPTGAVYTKDAIQAVAALCDRHGVPIISDEVYRAIHFGDLPLSPSAYSERCLVIDSVSKTFSMTGWRLGWCFVPPDLLRPLAAFHQLSVTCASAVSQYAALFALRGGADAEKERNRMELARRRDGAMLWLKKNRLRFIEPAGAFYILVDISGHRERLGTSLDIAKAFLAREKVVTIPGAAFGSQSEGFLRISFAADPSDLEEGIGRLGRFLNG